MPLEESLRNSVDAYCKRDLPGNLQWHIDQFSFISDAELQKKLGRAFYSARYVGKLMEALFAAGDEVHPFIKFQIMQYASIYEAVVSFLLWSRYAAHPEVLRLQTHKAYKPVNAFGSLASMKYGNEDIHTCVYRDAKTPLRAIASRSRTRLIVRFESVLLKGLTPRTSSEPMNSAIWPT